MVSIRVTPQLVMTALRTVIVMVTGEIRVVQINSAEQRSMIMVQLLAKFWVTSRLKLI
jgi:hypothetical protein